MSDGYRVMVMAAIRLMVGAANLLAGYLMYRSESVRTSLFINGMLGSVLPIVFMLVMAIGITGIATKVAPHKVAFLVVGSVLIVLGTR